MKTLNFDLTKLSKSILKQLIPNAGSVILALLISWAVGVYAAPGRAPTQGAAAVPNVINYQGRLADASGNPIDNTSPGVGMNFALYAEETGGSAVWTQGFTTVPVSEGLFSVPLQVDTNLLTGDLWLGIQVGADAEMTPREKLAAVPYAMQAGHAAEADTVPDGSVTNKKLALGGTLDLGSGSNSGLVTGEYDHLILQNQSGTLRGRSESSIIWFLDTNNRRLSFL